MTTIVMPMAGLGDRFLKSGYKVPKPLVEVCGKPMVQWAINSLDLEGHYIFITRAYENPDHNAQLHDLLIALKPNCKIICINNVTEGAACTALLAKDYMYMNQPMVLSDCDLALFWSSEGFLKFLNKYQHLDALSLVYNTNRPQNSYVEIDENFLAKRYAEKEIISKWSTNGVHYWRRAEYFVTAAQSMIKQNLRVNNEFYVSPTFNELIKLGYKVGIFPLEENQHHSLGSPDDVKKFEDYYNNRPVI